MVHAQDEVTPLQLEITLYSDGRANVFYLTEVDPTKVRVNVSLFGDHISSLVIRDEDGVPLGSTETATGIRVDTIGASELSIRYITSSLTMKAGPIWTLNVTTPIESKITLPAGATIIDISDIPSGLGITDGKQYVELQPGELSVYYIIGLPTISEEAQDVIDEAGTYVARKEAEGYILSDAQSLLTEAQSLFSEERYIEAKISAEQAISTTQSIIVHADKAEDELSRAENAVDLARENGRTDGLSIVEASLSTAQRFYDEGNYIEAETLARQVFLDAQVLKAPSSVGFYLGVLILVAGAGVAAFYLWKKSQIEEPPVPKPQQEESRTTEIDLDKIFWEHEDLRLEDKEVIKFLAESNGEAFATEIRNRFEIPRSSAWRLIRRLVNAGIMEEKKIGNQSLVRINEKYRK
ncbi:MAG: hypothetical protein NWE89_09120 [Candidatus Bathyarchaeota archaeon]|nr:hypothetical protein [Candidatus Bathyarchaeota archaeon]